MLSQEELKIISKNRLRYKGLSSSEAKNRLKKYGLNIREKYKKKPIWRLLWNIFTEPMMALIIVTGIIYFFLGDKLESLIFFLAIIPIGLIEFFQAKRIDTAILALDKILLEKIKVYRDNKLIDLEIKYLVPGDLVYLSAGDKIPADGYLLQSDGLAVDESILTGESISATKSVWPEDLQKIDKEHQVNQGTLVVQGNGFILVSATGSFTAYGKLGRLLTSIENNNETPLQYKINRLVKMVAILAVLIALFATLVLFFKQGLIEGVLGGITIAMAIIPEEFPVVFSVFLIMGVLRMSKKNALVREMVMVETLGSATVICADKTGTLTEGRMSLKKVYYQGNLFDIKKDKDKFVKYHSLVEASLLSLERVAVDPIEVEIQRYAKEMGINMNNFYKGYTLLKDGAFDSRTKMVHHLWQDKNKKCFQYTVGAPEAVLDASILTAEEKKKHQKVLEELFNYGYRLVAVARFHCLLSANKSSVDDENKCAVCLADVRTTGLEFMGFLAMSDPPRAGVKEAITTCQEAGIRVMMITGDNKLTAHTLAENINLHHDEVIASGSELENMSTSALQEIVKRRSIFARVQPEQKYLLVEALQKNGEVVAMTGDGVNDAPALKKANIGIAMGKKGTEVARAAAGIVLLDDNFNTIVSAIREGRRIYDNLRSAFVFLFSFHLPIIGLAILPLFFGQPLIFAPIHIIFLELICDPASVLGFEREKARRGLMKEKPRSIKEPLVPTRLWYRVLGQGLSILAVSLFFYFYFGMHLGDQALGRTLAISSLIISQTCLILFSREWEQVKTNKLLLIISLATILTLLLFLFVPFLSNIFYFVSLDYKLLGLVFVVPILFMFLVGVFLKWRKI